jgi:hypothetical protein
MTHADTTRLAAGSVRGPASGRHGRHLARAGAGFDHQPRRLDGPAAQACALLRGGQATQVHYAGLAADRAALKAYLDSLSAVPAAVFAAWPKAERQAFLINAYNAFTVELILTRHPDLKSIKDLGSLLSSPWKPKWIALLGTKVSLDDIEHAMLRKRGDYDDPRVHFAVNCASIGCPALREEAFTAARMDAQLDEQTLRFMSDRTRNRFNAQRGRLELSKIFDWYGEDFRLGHRGIASLPAFAARFADQLADAPADRAAHPRRQRGHRLHRLRLGAQRRPMKPVLSIVMPALERGRRHRAPAGGLAAAARTRGRDRAGRRRQHRRHARSRPRPGSTPWWQAGRGRALQMNAGAAAASADRLLFLHADTRLPPLADVQVLQALAGGACWGRFDVRIEGRPPMLRVVAT